MLQSLKKKKIPDPYGLISELFRPENIGYDLKYSLLLLLNGIQETFTVPKLMSPVNIITVFKLKGSRNELMNERGIFIINKFRDI